MRPHLRGQFKPVTMSLKDSARKRGRFNAVFRMGDARPCVSRALPDPLTYCDSLLLLPPAPLPCGGVAVLARLAGSVVLLIDFFVCFFEWVLCVDIVD